MKPRPSTLLPRLAALGAALAGAISAGAEECALRLPVTVAGYAGDSAFADFPALVRLAEGSPAGFSYADCAADGSDIRFADAAGAALAFDVDTWDTNGESCIWVKLPSMRRGTAFEMRYGGAPTSSNDPAATWSAYGAVWHLGEASGTCANATAAGAKYAAAPQGDTASSVRYAGDDAPVGHARRTATEAARGWLRVPDVSDLGYGSSFTMSGWVRLDSLSGWPRLFSGKDAHIANDGWEIEMASSMSGFTARGSGNSALVSGSFSPSLDKRWSYVALRYDGAALTVFQDGRAVKSGTVAAPVQNAYGIGIGCNATGSNSSWARGAFDECRLMGGAAPDDWIAADYAAQTGTLLSFGAVFTNLADRIEVVGSPEAFGEPSPGYGTTAAEAGRTYVLSCPATGANAGGSHAAVCRGWKLYRAGEAAPFRTSADAGEAALSCTVVYSEPVRIEWLWGDLRERGWRYDPSANTMTELDPPGGGAPWVLKCSASGTELTVKSVQQIGTNAVVDLSLPVATAEGFVRAVVELGVNAFFENTALEEVRLPDTLRTIRRGAFDGCTALRRIAPYLPDSVTSVGVTAFRNVPAGGTLRLGFGGPFSFLIDDRGWNGNEYFRNAGVEEVVLGPGVTSLPWYAFDGCASLTNLDLRATTALASIGLGAFRDCTALRRVEPFLPDAVSSIGVVAFCGAPVEGTLRLGFGGPLALLDDQRGWSMRHYFERAAVGRIEFGAGVTNVPFSFAPQCALLTNVVFRGTNAVALGDGAFGRCPALTNVLARPPLRWSGSPFSSTCPDLNGRILYPKSSRDWDGRIAELGDAFSPWDGGATAAQRELYGSLFPDGPAPRGFASAGGPKRWFVPVPETVPGAVAVTIVGEPYDVGAASPAYADLYAAEPPVGFSVSRYGERAGVVYESVGYRVDAMGADFWTPGEPVLGAREFSFDLGEEDMCRVAWLWREAGYALATNVPPSGVCSVSVAGTVLSDPGIAGAYYASNTAATIVATPRPGTRFVRWFGDVPEDQAASATATIAMDGVKSVTPYVEDRWTYDSVAKTVTDGYWVLNVTGEPDALRIASVRSRTEGLWLLDLRKPTDGCVFATIGINAFKGKEYLEEVRLPDTLQSILRGAFDGCRLLRLVTPFLPDSVASVGVTAFRNVPAGGTLRLGFGGPFAFLPDDQGWNWSEYFANAGVEEIVLGPGVTAVPWNAFNGCASLTNLDMRATTNLSSIGLCAFQGCTSLRRVDPLLPDTVARLGVQAFGYAPVEGALRLGFGGPFTMLDDERGWNAGHFFEHSNIGEIVFGPGVSVVKRGFALGCAALTNVVFRGTNLVAVEYDAFRSAPALEEVTFRSFPTFGGNVFLGVPATARFFVPDDVPEWQAWLDDPANATPWAELSDAARAEYFARWPVRPSRPKWRVVKSNAPFPKSSWVLRYITSEPTLLLLR